MEILNKIEIYFLLFMTYAVLGWCMEVICKIISGKRFINRGFLIGPYCPIYGWGAIAITVLLNRYLLDPLVLFIMAIIICSILEYFTSYFMEKIFHARWWDYSKRKYNINGRICLETMIPFGILGVIIMYFVNPFFIAIYAKISTIALHIISIVLFLIIFVDSIISSNIISSINKEGANIIKDNTEEITEKVKQILSQKSMLHRRLIEAFPDLKDIKIKIKNKKKN